MDKLAEFITTYPFLFGGTLLVVVALVAVEMVLRSRGTFQVSVVQAVRMINNGATVVDVRSAEKYAAGHIVGAIHIEADALGKGDNARLKKKKPLLIVCDDGRRSQQCARTLQAAGFDSAFSLGGGLGAWQQASQLLVSGN